MLTVSPSAPTVHSAPAPVAAKSGLSPFVAALKVQAERVAAARIKANELGLGGLPAFPSDAQLAAIEQAYATFEADYSTWLDAFAARSDEAEDELAVEHFASGLRDTDETAPDDEPHVPAFA